MPFVYNPLTNVFDISKTGGSGGGVSTLTGNTGGAISSDGSGNINVVGSGGVAVDGNAGTHTLTITISGSGFTWNYVTLTTVAMLPENGYITTAGMLTTLTLPLTSNIGDTFKIVNTGGGGIQIAQNAKQGIVIGGDITTAGVTGYLSSSGVSQNYSSVDLVCVFSNAAANPAYIYAATASVGLFGVN